MDRVRDRRDPGFFMVDNEVLDDYELDEIEFYVYSKICRHANPAGRCFFSFTKLKKRLKWGNTTLSVARKNLVKKKLILAILYKGIGYRFDLLPVKKKVVVDPSPLGKTTPNPSPLGKTPSPLGKTTLPPTGNKEDLIKEDVLKKTNDSGAVDSRKSPAPIDESPDPFQREPNPEAAAVFKNIAAGKPVEKVPVKTDS